MIKSIRGLAFRFFRTNKFVAFSSIISVMLSIFLNHNYDCLFNKWPTIA